MKILKTAVAIVASATLLSSCSLFPEGSVSAGMTNALNNTMDKTKIAMLEKAGSGAFKEIGDVKLSLKDYEWAKEAYVSAIDFNPSDSGAVLGMVNTMMLTSGYEPAVKLAEICFQKARASEMCEALKGTVIEMLSKSVAEYGEELENPGAPGNQRTSESGSVSAE